MKQNLLYSQIIVIILLISCTYYQPSIAEEIENPRYHYHTKIILISRVFESITINGYHNNSTGFGFDESITLKEANNPRIIGLLLIFNDTQILEKNYHGGWIHTHIEITNFSGFIKNQQNILHVCIFGECEIIKLTAGRG